MKTYSSLIRQERIDKVMSQRRNDLALVLENLSEDLNISAILRTAEGFGISKICIVYDTKKPHLSKNTSSGATKWLEISYYKSITTCLNSLKKSGYQLFGALVDPNAKLLWEQDFSGKIAVVMGNEAKGLSKKAQKLVNVNIYLPMYGLTESLNVSVATALFLYEVIRQKEKRD